MRILFFGDSITQGFWAKDGGWVELIRKYYDGKAIDNNQNGDEPQIFNLGISGDTTRSLLERIVNETKSRIWKDEPVVVVIAIGTNDDLFESDEQWVPPKEFQSNLQLIIDKVSPLAHRIILVGNPACDEKLTTPVSWGDFSYTNTELARSEKTIGEVAKQNELLYVPLFDAFKAELENGMNLLADGLHPNDEGHKFIYKTVKPYIDRLID